MCKLKKTVALDKLTVHPKRKHYFQTPSEAETECLAKEIKANGLRKPIEISKGGVIISGYDRFLAAVKLGLKKIECIVVTNGDESEEEIELRMLEANIDRRYLSGLGLVRCYRRMIDISCNLYNDFFEDGSDEDLRDDIARRYGNIDPNILEDMYCILDLPIEIQNAFENGQIGLDLIYRITSLSKKGQKIIVEGILSGENIEDVFQCYVLNNEANKKSNIRVLDEFQVLMGKINRNELELQKITDVDKKLIFDAAKLLDYVCTSLYDFTKLGYGNEEFPYLSLDFWNRLEYLNQSTH